MTDDLFFRALRKRCGRETDDDTAEFAGANTDDYGALGGTLSPEFTRIDGDRDDRQRDSD